MVRGASGDEWGEIIGGKGTIGLQAAVPKKPHTRNLMIFKGDDSGAVIRDAKLNLEPRSYWNIPSYDAIKLNVSWLEEIAPNIIYSLATRPERG